MSLPESLLPPRFTQLSLSHSLKPTMSSPSPPPPNPQYNNLINLLHTKLPQELYDQIESTTYEMIFCPGYLYFDVSVNKDADGINGKPANAARPELLCLSKHIYKKYMVRMWQENICMVKTESGKMRIVQLIKDHLDGPATLAYLDSISEDKAAVHSLHDRLVRQRIHFPRGKRRIPGRK
ncbi:MAG: hypothetical protein Q9169_003107 [Polycauliona sp. 2 TL-2023]